MLPATALQTPAATAQSGQTPTSGDTAADSAACLPAGGVDVPYEADTSAVVDGAQLVLAGGGWGHGVGMSQFGAQGAAKLGCSTATILSTYYPGTELGVMAKQRETVAVHLLKRALQSTTIRTTSAAAGGVDLPWMNCDLSGDNCTVAVMQPAGSEWAVTPRTDGTFVLSSGGIDPSICPVTGAPAPTPTPTATTSPSASPTATPSPSPSTAAVPAGCQWRGGNVETRLRMVHDGTVIRVVDAGGRRVKWGWTEFDYSSKDGGVTYVTQYVTGNAAAGMTALDRYLYGLGEMPSSWDPAALRVQAIAGRSYAEATIATREGVYGRDSVGGYIDRNECRCDLFATTVDQVYGGFDHEDAETGKWKTAVEATVATVMLFQGKPVAAFYSSSHGGSSEDVEHVWGTPLAYLPAVDTSRWEAEIAPSNTRDRWTASYTHAQLASRFGLADVSSFSIDQRGPGGRPSRLNGGGVTVVGTSSGGAAVTIHLSGESLRSKLSLFSSLAYVYDPNAEPVDPEPTDESTEVSSEPAQIDITPACPDGEVPEDGSTDVAEGSTHEAAIDCIVWWGVDAPDAEGSFEAARAIRRDEMAQWLFEILTRTDMDLPESPPNAFSDDDGNPHEFAINTLAYLALVAGTGDGKYSPADNVSRAQMASFWVRLLTRIEGEDLDGSGDPFTDDDGTTHEDAITRLYNAGVTAGVEEGRYDIFGKVTRAQMSSFGARVLARLVTGEFVELPES